jgi:DNA-binding beta-propeller fold protein YncE
MKSNSVRRFFLVAASALAITVSAHPGQEAEHQVQKPQASARSANNLSKPVKLIGAILVPGNPLRFDISWVDQATGRYYLAEGGNAGVDVFDAENDLYLGRIAGFHGVGAPDDPCGPIEGMGPSGILVTPDNHLWVADFPGKVWAFDLSKPQPPFGNLNPMAPPLSTGASCRSDEIGYDPKDHVIVAGNPGDNPPFATFISSDPPFQVLGKITFSTAAKFAFTATGLEQPLWVPEFERLFVPVQGESQGVLAVVKVDKSAAQKATIEKTYSTPNCNGSGLALGPLRHLLVGCDDGKPLLIMNAQDGKIIKSIPQIHGSDEVWYNSGDRLFYAASGGAPNPALGVIDAETSTFVQTIPSGPNAHSVAAFAKSNHIFVPIGATNPKAPVNSNACVKFGLPESNGCVAVYGH